MAENLENQIKKKISKPIEPLKEYEGDMSKTISTGSTLLDLAISGGRSRQGGIPGGIFVEISGVASSGKTVLLCEIAGDSQRQGGKVLFYDPEARLNKQFAKIFCLDMNSIDYVIPDTIPQVFQKVRDWDISSESINVIAADSLAALSTDLEIENKEGDKMGMRRAKEFSEELRKTTRIITKKNILMVCSNQVRINPEAGPYGQKYVSPGGESIGFYSSLRLRVLKPEKLYKEITIKGNKVKKSIGIRSQFEVFKSSVWKPFRSAPVTILFDYGIDDIRENLQFIKDFSSLKTYSLKGEKLDISLEKSILLIEKEGKEKELKEEVIDLWNEVEEEFSSNRIKIRS